MTTSTLAGAPESVTTPRRFLVLWQEADSRRFQHVGTLEHSSRTSPQDDGFYTFVYSPMGAGTARFPGFPSFPDRQRTYVSRDLFPMFANRVMTSRRDGYQDYLHSIGLSSPQAEPFEVLTRTWGQQATDHIQLLPVPVVQNGILTGLFQVHGGRHVDPDGTRLAAVRAGDALFLGAEPDNAVNPLAVLVGSQPHPNLQHALGYLPDVFASLVTVLMRSAGALRITAERVNAGMDNPRATSIRLLARLDAEVPPDFDVEAALWPEGG
jgi:hypothetical protein